MHSITKKEEKDVRELPEILKCCSKSKTVTIIIPTLNEEENIGETLCGLQKIGYTDILVVDARSTDKTVKIANSLGAKIIFQKGNGKGDALREAFVSNCVTGDIVVFMDADGSMDPREIPHFIKAIEKGADLAKGSRFLDHGYTKDMTLTRRVGNLFLLFVVNTLHDTKYSDLCYGFGAFRRSALNKIHPHLKSTNFEIEAEVFIKAKKLGLSVVEVPSVEYERKNGTSNLNTFRDGFRIFRTIITESINGYH
ncbi:MAG: glycosyltransferase family 2 protein [Candidatus Bathyarchaeota archaeon]|nr:glycosyltransferase family 2 protein [Candidatus Bathyarchaeum tardum]